MRAIRKLKYRLIMGALRRFMKPDSNEHFAYVLLCEGMQQLESASLASGTAIKSVLITPNEKEGYDFSTEDTSGIFEETTS